MTSTYRLLTAAAFAATLAPLASCGRTTEAPPPQPAHQFFQTPEAAVQALGAAAGKGDLAAVVAIFGPEGQALLDSSDELTARQNLETFSVAFGEGWRLADEGQGKTLEIGHEGWPFPVPLVKDAGGWRFDTAAGREEVIARRIGRNELAAITACHSYVAAQERYARTGHDGKKKGLFAAKFRSDPGLHDGLYWPVTAGQPRSPLGDLVADAEAHAALNPGAAPEPFHGYYYRILTAQGEAAPGGARNYVSRGELTGGFALVAWPAEYDVTGIMTFLVNRDGVVWQKDLGPDTASVVQQVTAYNPDASWSRAEE